jgi:DNA-binding NtrC family response regulator
LSEEVAQRTGDTPPELTPEALALLAGQHWRGNARELRNVLEQLAMRSDSPRIDAAEVKRVLAETGLESIAEPQPLATNESADVAGRAARAALLRPLAEQTAELERRAIRAALAATGGNKQAAARMLGISRATLYERVESLKLALPA